MFSTIETIKNEVYAKRCGEIYLTLNGYIVFHCTLCDEKFYGLELYVAHIESIHQTMAKVFSNPSNDFYEKAEYLVSPKIELMEYSLDANITKFEESGCGEENPLDMDVCVNATEKSDAANVQDTIQMKQTPLQVLSKSKIKKKFRKKTKTELSDEASTGPEHIRQIQTKTKLFEYTLEGRPHKCQYCPAAFKNLSNFRKHESRHKTQKNVQCMHCSKFYYSANDLKKHMTCHDEDPKFLCTTCGKRLTSSVKFKEHMRHTKMGV